MKKIKISQKEKSEKIFHAWKKSTGYEGSVENRDGLYILRLRDQSALCDSNFRTHSNSNDSDLLRSLRAFREWCILDRLELNNA